MQGMSNEDVITQIKNSLNFTNIEIHDEEPKAEIKGKEELYTEGKYIEKTEKYRRAINLSENVLEICDLALKCIRDITGDELFYKNNISKVYGERK